MSDSDAPNRIFSISADQPFVDALAAGLLDRYGHDPLTLSDTLVLLPTRRACRSLREAFLRVMPGQALLLPRMRPIGDVDEDELVLSSAGDSKGALRELLDLPPAISETERLLQLSRLVRAHRDALAAQSEGFGRLGPDQALLLAKELAHFLNQVQTEGLTLDGLDALVPEDYADHWVKTLGFLDILRTVWPAYLDSTGQSDPAARRDALLRAQASAWLETPPNHPVVAAGSTGSIPATGALISAVSQMPQGLVVLPGLDNVLDADSWDNVRADPTHAQHGLCLLLDRLDCPREAVRPWQEARSTKTALARARLISEALRPAATIGRWMDLERLDASAFDGVTWLSAPSPAAEAALVAQALREALDVPGKTAALVTPDRTLARRVGAQMTRWGIQIDDTAGMSLGNTQAGRFFKLISEAAAARLAPVALLALLKHPLAAIGAYPPAFRASVRGLETALLRGPKPASGIRGLHDTRTARALEQYGPDPTQLARADRVIEAIEAALTPLIQAMESADMPFHTLLETHIAAAEALAEAADADGPDRLWAGEDGQALADFLAGLTPHAGLLGPVSATDYDNLIDALMTGQTVRPRYGAHPRVFIMGPLEARLWQADRMILAGLNEGSWPPEPPQDPWMSSDMRHRFGLPAHERRIGLSAHDFAQAFSAKEVVLIRAEKSGGQQTVPARWLERLASVSERVGLEAHLPKVHGLADQFLAWQAKIDGAERLPPLKPPNPKPPLTRRPKRLSATRVQTLIEDPYAIFASRVLGLTPLDPLEADLGAADKGTMIHSALDKFAKEHPDLLQQDALSALLKIGQEAFGADTLARPMVWAFWWPRFVRIAEWFIAEERARRPRLTNSITEVKGTMTFAVTAPDGLVIDFTLSAEADRIDRFRDGGYAIVDYKTGGVPSGKKVASLAAPQLPLEAAILAAGGFPDVAPGPVRELAYWKLIGGNPAGLIQVNNTEDPNDLAAAVRQKLAALITAYADVEQGYPCMPRAAFQPLFDDYAHLSRRQEWGLSGGVEEK